MSSSLLVRCALVVVISSAVVIGATVLVRSLSLDSADSAGDQRDAFREEAEKAGVAFRMNFLTDEQGRKFKVNLYDHGCGVAVGDYQRRRQG